MSEIIDLKKNSISNLILIIMNNKNSDGLRKYAEIELKKRIKNVGWDYNDLLHFDDKVIKERGLDVNNYLISQNVNMQQLMETFFLYCFKRNEYDSLVPCEVDEINLLFSEKHLCNINNYCEPFFKKICHKESENIIKKLKVLDSQLNTNSHDICSDYGEKIYMLRDFRDLIDSKFVTYNRNMIDSCGVGNLIATNDAFLQLDDHLMLELLNNASEEELYKLSSTKLGLKKLDLARILNEGIFDTDLIQDLYTMKFVLKDSAKLKLQKQILLNQVKSGYSVDYDSINTALELRKK